MRPIIFMTLGIMLFSLTACHTSAEIEGEGYRIRTDSGGYYGGGHRNGPPGCPPGHAKKGWC